MNTLREAAQQALEALGSSLYPQRRQVAAIAALKAALAEPVQSFEDEQRAINAEEHRRADALAEPVQEPVAWRYQDARGNYRYRGYVQGFDKEYSLLKPVPLYTAPPQRKPLTEGELKKATREVWRSLPSDFDYTTSSWVEIGIRYAEKAHGIIS